MISSINRQLEVKYQSDTPDVWKTSEFRWMKELPSATRGKVAEEFIREWAKYSSIRVGRATSTEYDMSLNGIRTEVKSSTLWADGGYRFQQIRSQGWDALLLLGISPTEMHTWFVPRELVNVYIIGKMGQHTGSAAKETSWLRVVPGNEPDWLAPYGKSFDDVHKLLSMFDTP